MRALACVLLALAASTTAAAGAQGSPCPPVAGTIAYAAGTRLHAVDLRSCTDRVAGNAAVPGVRTTGSGSRVPLLRSGDGRWVFFFVDQDGSVSGIADGTPLYVASTRGGPVHELGPVLPRRDSLTWCGGELVYTPGTDRVAIDGKRLMAARPPDWTPRPLWNDRARTFGSPACEPGRDAVAVLSQHTSKDAHFFATRWRLWRVGLNGSRRILDVPPPGWADEQPTWAPDGDSIAFVRERNGYGRIMIRTQGRLFGPVAALGYSLGYYGHHDWGLAWRP